MVHQGVRALTTGAPVDLGRLLIANLTCSPSEERMPQFTRFMPLPPGAYRAAVDRVLIGLRALPAEGEPFREFRNRLKRLEIYSRERLPDIRAFLRVPEADAVLPVGILGQLRAAADLDQAAQVIAERLYAVNPLLFKSVVDRVRERVNGPSELLKFLDSFAYPGVSISGPEVRTWLAWAQGLGVLRPVGVGLALGERGALFLKRVDELDIDEFLEDDLPEPPLEGPPPGPAASVAAVEHDAPGPAGAYGPDAARRPDAAVAPSTGAGPTATEAPGIAVYAPTPTTSGAPSRWPTPAGDAVTPGAPTSAPASDPPSLPDPDLAGLDLRGAPPPRAPAEHVPVADFSSQAQAAVFEAGLLGTTARWLDQWWQAARGDTPTALWGRIGFGGEAWQEDPEAALYRLAVAAALRADASGHDTVRDAAAERAWRSLDSAGLLDALHQGAGLKGPLPAVDPAALLAASLVARRLAEHPDLAGDLERCADAEAAEAALQASLGRGFLSPETIAWLLGALGRSGVLRVVGLDQRLAAGDRAARDTLFRLGFVASPYAGDVEGLVAAAAAARLAVPGAERSEQALRAFAFAAGCAYRCPHSATCGLACRERADRG